MARRGGIGGADDLIWIVLLGGAGYVAYYAISHSTEARVCGALSAAQVASIREQIAALIASYIKRNSNIGNSLSSIKSTTLKYVSSLNSLAQKNFCQQDIDFTRSPPDFWKGLATLILYICAHHNITLNSGARSALITMQSTGNGELLNSRMAVTTARAYETIDPEYNPYGFLLADSIYNVMESKYRFHYQNGPKARELSEAIDVSNTDAPAIR